MSVSCSPCTVISLQLAVPHVVNNTETGGEDLMTRDWHRVTFDTSRTRVYRSFAYDKYFMSCSTLENVDNGYRGRVVHLFFLSL